MDAGKYYALLRFEEAALALRAALRLGMVDTIGDRIVTPCELAEIFGFTEQATRTFVALLDVMEVLHREGNSIRVAERARECLSVGASSTRQPYLAMGTGTDVEQFIRLLQGDLPQDSLPLYARDDAGDTIMDQPNAASEIAFGLASRARNFAEPLAKAFVPYASKSRILADIGAGSPFVAMASLNAVPHLARAILVDRANSMQFAGMMAKQNGFDDPRLEFLEQDFFQAVPAADIYCLSNTAHDWLPQEYSALMTNVRDSIAPGGVVCIHEPLLVSTWNSAEQWVNALWMACYALTLFRLTEGKGTCYTRDEHDAVMDQNGFVPVGEPVPTVDGCTALFYQLRTDSQRSSDSPMGELASKTR